MSFKDNFKKLRMLNNLTQDDIAKEIGISRQSVSKWENGINEPDLETIEKLCVIFHCSPNDLILDTDSSNQCPAEDMQKNRELLFKILFIVITILFLAGLVVSTIFFLRFVIDKYNYLNDPSTQGMAPSLGLDRSFKTNELHDLATKLANDTYSKEVVDANPNLVESAKATILGKYTLVKDIYWYNEFDREYVANNNYYWLILPIVVCVMALVTNTVTFIKHRKKVIN